MNYRQERVRIEKVMHQNRSLKYFCANMDRWSWVLKFYRLFIFCSYREANVKVNFIDRGVNEYLG